VLANPLKANLDLNSPTKLQSGSHPALNSLSAFFLAGNSNELVRQPSDVRASFSSDIFRAWEAVLESPGDGIDAVD
jgi:hypothetical protein